MYVTLYLWYGVKWTKIIIQKPISPIGNFNFYYHYFDFWAAINKRQYQPLWDIVVYD